jgi:hypothetical protein
MNDQSTKTEGAVRVLSKTRSGTPVLMTTGATSLVIRGGTIFNGRGFDFDTIVPMGALGLEAGGDYAVLAGDSAVSCERVTSLDPLANPDGFHVAPGGNAPAREGGDQTPAINPCSLWDVAFMPACKDPRGMAFVAPIGKWVDIYLLAKDHLQHGTSRLGATIADGNDPPQNRAGGYFRRLDFETAAAVMKHHGKQLLTYSEFVAAALGVKERSSADEDPETTKLDAPRTSRFGLMQATGSLWVWGTDGDPDDPRPSIFGGSWVGGSTAGSRFASLDCWPGGSGGNLGARGRSDHLQLD